MTNAEPGASGGGTSVPVSPDDDASRRVLERMRAVWPTDEAADRAMSLLGRIAQAVPEAEDLAWWNVSGYWLGRRLLLVKGLLEVPFAALAVGVALFLAVSAHRDLDLAGAYAIVGGVLAGLAQGSMYTRDSRVWAFARREEPRCPQRIRRRRLQGVDYLVLGCGLLVPFWLPWLVLSRWSGPVDQDPGMSPVDVYRADRRSSAACFLAALIGPVLLVVPVLLLTTHSGRDVAAVVLFAAGRVRECTHQTTT